MTRPDLSPHPEIDLAEKFKAEDPGRCWAECVINAIDVTDGQLDEEEARESIRPARKCQLVQDSCYCGQARLYNGRVVVMGIDDEEWKLAARRDGDGKGGDPW